MWLVIKLYCLLDMWNKPHKVDLFLGVGEAQKIDRIMEKFAERYCRDNPGAFRSADGAYLLAFALIMLNTDAHNPQADKKLGLDDFINMCQVQVGSFVLSH